MNSLGSFRIMWNSLRFTNSLRSHRNFSLSTLSKDSKPISNNPVSAGEPSKTNPEHTIGGFKHKVSNFDKWILVTTKKYPSKDQVPKYVADDVLQNAMSQVRIRVANVLIVLSLICIICTVLSSRQLKQEYVDSMEHTRTDYRKQITEEFRQKMTEESAHKP
ncbi:UPF0389 protein CG9231 [Diachasma alloeum]|uniref:UPF0389 protein CG9231 n=1 Tax=Diachasma alloeum TaxID=454923 RepID=UPI000738426F|nr:UPF0389 protein CG9231 [Diachasma alloeum]XP_015118777.1 UPF0389 protein CG9231 [Diachasma alloeum]